MEEASKPFWDNFPKSLIPTRTNLARPCSSPDTVTEGVKSSQIIPVKKFAGEELVSKTARSYPLIVKSSNSVVSGILRSLTDIKYKDYKNVVPLSSVSPSEEKMKIPVLKENAVMIHNEKVYLLAIHDITTKASDTLLSRQCVAKQNIKCLPTLATHQDEISKVTHFFSHRMTTMSQPKQCCPLSGKGQQALLNKTDFQSEDDLQPRNWKEVRKEEDNKLRKEFGILKDVRVHLTRIRTSELTKDSDKASTFKWKFLSKAAFPSKEDLQKTRGKEACQEEDNELKKVFGIIEDGKNLFREDSNLI
nr:uncharacterized protein LOC106049400 isoform X3 [Anser cygnoides]